MADLIRHVPPPEGCREPAMSNGELAMWVKCLRGLDRAGVRVVRMDRDTIHRLQRAVDLMPASDAHEVLFYRRLRMLPRG